MSITAIVHALVESGATPQMILAAVAADENIRLEKEAIKREQARQRVIRYRKNKSLNNNDPVTVTPVTNVSKKDPLSSPLSLSPDPLPLPPYNPPKKDISPECEEFWKFWPKERRSEKPKFVKEWKVATGKAEPKIILAAGRRYLQTREVKDGFAPYPARWLKNERWMEFSEAEGVKSEATDDGRAKSYAWQRSKGLFMDSQKIKFLEDFESKNGPIILEKA